MLDVAPLAVQAVAEPPRPGVQHTTKAPGERKRGSNRHSDVRLII